LAGGWRIIHTVGKRLTKLKPRTGFCAEGGAAASILLATFLKLPVSTTHVTAGAIAGVGAVQRVKAGALGSGFEYSVGLGFDDSRVGVVRLGV
jgi:inorganic phosphate transporter, PiT family